MKKTLMMAAFAVLCMGMANAKNVKTSFAVNGKCGMCKKNIEAAAKSVDGVDDAKWCKNGKKLTVSFDDAKTSVKAIQKKVAAAGYDTDKYKAKKKVYNALPECCKYRDSNTMEIKGSCCNKETKEGSCSAKEGKQSSCCGKSKQGSYSAKEAKQSSCCGKSKQGCVGEK